MKSVKMTSSEAVELISMLNNKVYSLKEDINNAHTLWNMDEEHEEVNKYETLINKLDATFWDKNGELI